MTPRSWCSHGALAKAKVILNPNRKATIAAATRSCLMSASHEQNRYIRNGARQRLLGTSSSTAAFTTLQQRGGRRGGGEGHDGTAKDADSSADAPAISPTATVSTPPFVLPVPSWSLADLKLVRRVSSAEDDEAHRAVLTREEVNKLCALAHIDLAPEDGDAAGGGLDVAAVQRDVGAMLRCMQTMRRENDGGRSREGRTRVAEKEEEEEEEEERKDEGPWGGAVTWAAPLQEDIVSVGGIQEQVLGSAQRTEAGFFVAPRVVGGEEGVP